MRLTRLQAAVILGLVIPQIFSTSSVSSPPSDCWAAVNTCMSDLCRSEQAFTGGTCGVAGCQIKGSEVCNMTIQTALDRFPSLRGCVCAWEEQQLCGSIQMLAAQCRRQPVAQQRRRSTGGDWQSSSLSDYVYDGSGSCSDQMKVCVGDPVCNRYLIPVLQACMAEPCDRDRCQQVTEQFYGSMPRNVAEMLVMCKCEASDPGCVHMEAALHSGTCGQETWICQDRVNQCVDDSNCRDALRTFQNKCWRPEEARCSEDDLQGDECLAQMDPALIRGADAECKAAFLATLGTALHYPCTCKGMHDDELLTCAMIHDVLHNRSHFMTSSSLHPSKPHEINESEQSHTWSIFHADYLLYVFAAALLVGVVVLLVLVAVIKLWTLKRGDQNKCHHPQKSNCVL